MTSNARTRATAKYKAKTYKRIVLDYPIDYVQQVKDIAQRSGMSVSSFIRMCIDDKMATNIDLDQLREE